MSHQEQQSTRMIEYKYKQFFPSFAFVVLALSVTFLLSFQLINSPSFLNSHSYNIWVMVNGIILFLAIFNLGYFYTQLKMTYNEDSVFLGENLNSIYGTRVQEFYYLLDFYILDDDIEVTRLSMKIGKRRMLSFIIASLVLIITILLGYLILLLNHLISMVMLGTMLIGVDLVIGGHLFRKLHDLHETRKIHCELAAMIFHNHIDRIGLNLNSTPKTQYKRQLVDFLELAHFLQQYFIHYKKHLWQALIHGLLYATVGLLLLNLVNVTLLVQLVGYFIFYGAIGFSAIKVVQFQASKQIYHLATESLGSYLILV